MSPRLIPIALRMVAGMTILPPSMILTVCANETSAWFRTGLRAYTWKSASRLLSFGAPASPALRARVAKEPPIVALERRQPR